MVATELALTVAYPYAGNLEEVAVLWSTESQWRNRNFDYREKARYGHKRHVDKEGNVITGKYKTPLAIGIPEPLQEFLQFIKKALYEGNIETRNRIGGTWRYSHTKQEERLNSYREELTK
jgi:gamma-glutamyltranspeptidase/glutathione hydrolase